jgi:hypothetical protein
MSLFKFFHYDYSPVPGQKTLDILISKLFYDSMLYLDISDLTLFTWQKRVENIILNKQACYQATGFASSFCVKY